jgi:dTDP-4-dehydrorhamnose reductase
MRIGITGASGMLGTALIAKLSKKHSVFATARAMGYQSEGVYWDCFDITNFTKLSKWLNNICPDVVIHCAAMVNVDMCEKNQDYATKLHYKSTANLANLLDEDKKKLIYISTDSVFDGTKSGEYVESDKVNPLNIYAKTKLLGENPALSIENGLVIRTNIVGWNVFGKSSFAEWILNGLINKQQLALFSDVKFSPIHVIELSQIINRIIDTQLTGLFHCSSKDCLSKYEFGIKMAEIFNLPKDKIRKISIDDISLDAERPKNMGLSSSKLKSILDFDISSYDAIELMKVQYDNGWFKRIQGN